MFDVFDVVVSFVSCTVMMSFYTVCAASCLSSLCLLLMMLMLISCMRMFLSVLFGVFVVCV